MKADLIMTVTEKIEKLMERANVTREEAQEALDASSGDLLDAVIHLERQGKIKEPEGGGRFTTTPPEDERRREKNTEFGLDADESFARGFFDWCRKVFEMGNTHLFVVRCENKTVVSTPVDVLVLLLLFAFWVVIPLAVIGLFFGCRYSFCGPDLENTGVNEMMDAMADAADTIKKEFKED